MPESTHYTVLGVDETATPEEIRRAFRKLALRYHPDRSGDQSTTDRFVRITEAYQVLSDATRRSEYDRILSYRRNQAPRTSPPPNRPPPGGGTRDVASMLVQAAKLYNSGLFAEAESLAKRIVALDSTRALAHAILGDVARRRQDVDEAVRRYSYAVQHEPSNRKYMRTYEELLAIVSKPRGRTGRVVEREILAGPVFLLAAVSLLALVYTGAAKEEPMLPNFAPISTWGFGFLLMLFLNGLACGALLSIANALPSWETFLRDGTGRISAAGRFFAWTPICFLLSVSLYFLRGVLRPSRYDYASSRLFGLLSVLVLLYAFAAMASPSLDPTQTALWSGNVLSFGAMCGWAIAGAFR